MSDTGPPPDIIHFQLSVLDAYEKLLASCNWDETRLNEALKAMLASMLPLLRAQRALGEQLLASHQELLRHYRQTLEAALREPAGDGPNPPG